MVNSHLLVARSARRADVPELAMVLTRAFIDDPFFSWLLPDPATRHTLLPRLFRSMLYHHVLQSNATDVVTLRTADHRPRVIGGAVWAAPRGEAPATAREESAAFDPAAPRLARWLANIRYAAHGLRAAKGRLHHILVGLRQLSRLHPAEPHWYLDTIGTDPLAGHVGAGRALIEYRLAIIDRGHLPAYLEASTKGVVPFYQRFGFAPHGSITLPDGPTLWTMLRPPR